MNFIDRALFDHRGKTLVAALVEPRARREEDERLEVNRIDDPAIALLLPLGVAAASAVAALSPAILTGFFAFGLIALLYLVTEELLVEAHETPDRPWVTALFFVGFLLLLILEESMG